MNERSKSPIEYERMSSGKFRAIVMGLGFLIGFTILGIQWYFEPKRHPEIRKLGLITMETPHYVFTTQDGAQTRLEDFKGNVVVLNFWATWCAPCLKEMPSLNALQAYFQDQNVKVLAVSQDRKGVPVVKEFYEDMNLTALPIYTDVRGTAAGIFNLPGLPVTYVLHPDGHIIAKTKGHMDWNTPAVQAWIQETIDSTK